MPLPGQIPMPSVTQLGGNPMAALSQTASAGRPARPKPVALAPAGVSLGMGFNVAPEAVKQAQMKYLGSHQLPPAYAPKAAGIMERRRHQAIARGWQQHTNAPHLRRV